MSTLGDDIRALRNWHLSGAELAACLLELAHEADQLQATIDEREKP